MLLLYSTASSFEEAEKIVSILLEKKYIACANIHPISSLYTWNNNLEKSSEYALVMKSAMHLEHVIYDEIKKVHSYEVPCIISYHVKGGDAFVKWVEETCK